MSATTRLVPLDAIKAALDGFDPVPAMETAFRAFSRGEAVVPPPGELIFQDQARGIEQRTDRIGGRPALTVFYRLRDGTRLSYTVFSGRPVPRPAFARSVVYQGVPLHVFRTRNGLSVVTLVRFGRTCVLAARTPPSVVLGLAAAPVREQAA